jgi:hypothetical protein
VHYWLVAWDSSRRLYQRWEVWHIRNSGGVSWGHVHCGLLDPEADLGGGPTRVHTEWTGNTALGIVSVLERAPQYKFRDWYRAFPGPNSNTFVAWILHEAGIRLRLHWKGLGEGFLKQKLPARRQ